MYTYKNIEELDDKQLAELSKQGYKLCYVDFARVLKGLANDLLRLC